MAKTTATRAKKTSTVSKAAARRPTPASPDAYYAALPADRKAIMLQLRRAMGKALPKGFAEVIQHGMPGWVVPLSMYPPGYHCTPNTPLPFVGLASQKSHIAVYHMGVYADPTLYRWFTEEWAKRVPRKLDMGKSCIRFKKPDQVPVDLIADLCKRMTPKEWVALYEARFRR